MKTHHSKLLKKELLIVELPERTADFSALNTGDRIAVCAFDEYDSCLDVMPISIEYTLLGSPDEMKDDDVRELVHQSIHTGLFAHYVKDIPVNTYCYKTALESFFSAIESEILWNVNPLQSTPPTEDLSFYDSKEQREIAIQKYSKAQTRTFDRNRTLIFYKN